MSVFVIVVDVQADFMRADGALSIPGAEALIGPMDGWLRSLRPEETAGVLFTFDTHLPGIYAASQEAELFPPHCMKGTPGWHSVLDPSAVDRAIPRYRLEKSVFDMWAEPGLAVEPVDAVGGLTERDGFFERLLDQGVRRVVVAGVAADFCVRWAIDGLLARGFEVEVPAALTRGIERDMAAVADELNSSSLAVR